MTQNKKLIALFSLALALTGITATTHAQDSATQEAAAPEEKGVYTLVIQNHVFTPDEIRAPAGEKIKLVIKNMDPTAEEFESHELRREKIIAGNSEAIIHVGPLKAGTYEFVGEFNEDTAKGRLIIE